MVMLKAKSSDWSKTCYTDSNGEFAVNAIAPGVIDLEDHKYAPAFLKRMAKKTPMLKNGRGEEIGAAVLFFATAPQFITGQILAVDGGLGL